MFLRAKSSCAPKVANGASAESKLQGNSKIQYTNRLPGVFRRLHGSNDFVFFRLCAARIADDRVEENLTENRELGALLSRVEQLEKQNRRLKQGALAFVLAIASVGLMAQTKQKPATSTSSQKPKPRTAAPAPTGPTAVEAQAFILKDSNGHVRAELGLTGSTPSLKLKDESGSALVTLALNSDAPGGPMLLLSDPQHHASVALSVLEHAGPQLALTGERADIQLHMGVAPEGTTLELSDKDGFTTSIGSGVVAKNGQAKQTSAASIVLYGKQRKVLWSVP
jgi:hypothetical protein